MTFIEWWNTNYYQNINYYQKSNFWNNTDQSNKTNTLEYMLCTICRNVDLLPEAATQSVLKICSKFTGEHPCRKIYRRTPMPKCDFNKAAKQLYWNRTSAWVFSCKFAACFPKNTSERLLLCFSIFNFGFKHWQAPL